MSGYEHHDVDCGVDDCPAYYGGVHNHFPFDDVDNGPIVKHVDQHDCAANHCQQHNDHSDDCSGWHDNNGRCINDDLSTDHVDGIRSDDQHDAEHNLDRAIAQYLNDRRNPNLTDTQYHATVVAVYDAAEAVCWLPAGDR